MSRSARLSIVLAANLALVGALVVVGVAAHSIGVFAEGADYLADAAAIAVSLVAIRLRARPPTRRHPDGFPHATAYAALVNAGWLLVLSALIAAGAVVRLAGGVRAVHGLPVVIVSGVAGAVMLAGAVLLGGDVESAGEAGEADRGDDLNLRAVLLDTAADAAAAAGVALTGAIIAISGGLSWLDPVVALAIAVVVGYHAWRLVTRIIGVLG